MPNSVVDLMRVISLCDAATPEQRKRARFLARSLAGEPADIGDVLGDVFGFGAAV